MAVARLAKSFWHAWMTQLVVALAASGCGRASAIQGRARRKPRLAGSQHHGSGTRLDTHSASGKRPIRDPPAAWPWQSLSRSIPPSGMSWLTKARS